MFKLVRSLFTRSREYEKDNIVLVANGDRKNADREWHAEQYRETETAFYVDVENVMRNTEQVIYADFTDAEISRQIFYVTTLVFQYDRFSVHSVFAGVQIYVFVCDTPTEPRLFTSFHCGSTKFQLWFGHIYSNIHSYTDTGRCACACCIYILQHAPNIRRSNNKRNVD